MQTTLRILLAGFSIAWLACELPKTAAVGDDHEIIVFADDSTWWALEPALRHALEDTVLTPAPERWFELKLVRFEEFAANEKQKNRLIVGPLDGEGPVARYVQNSLDEPVRNLVLENKEFFFAKYDSRARAQLTIFLTGPTLAAMEASIDNRAADLLYYFKKMNLRRELAAIESEKRYHKKEIEKKLEERYGWTMTIQHDYFVAIDSASSRFFWIRRATPADLERWIFVHWIDEADPSLLTDEFVLSLRNSLTRLFYRTLEDTEYVEIAPYNLKFERVNFLDRFAIETRGNWRFSDKSGGGPFVNYTFYDESTRRIFMLDGSIFAPRVEKKKLILQVDALLHTFRTAVRPGGKTQTAG